MRPRPGKARPHRRRLGRDWYISLVGQPKRVYVGTVASVGPALVLAKPGDPVTITILDIGTQESTETMRSFADASSP
jgi:hypothetical protein